MSVQEIAIWLEVAFIVVWVALCGLFRFIPER